MVITGRFHVCCEAGYLALRGGGMWWEGEGETMYVCMLRAIEAWFSKDGAILSVCEDPWLFTFCCAISTSIVEKRLF